MYSDEFLYICYNFALKDNSNEHVWLGTTENVKNYTENISEHLKKCGSNVAVPVKLSKNVSHEHKEFKNFLEEIREPKQCGVSYKTKQMRYFNLLL